MLQYQYGFVQYKWSPWKSLPLLIIVGISAGLIVAGLALGLGLGIGLHNDSQNLTSIISSSTNVSRTTITTANG